jgi:hypothetical protein
MAERIERRLTTILAADVAEYSRLMPADEAATLTALTMCRALIDPLIAEHRGRIADTARDSLLAEFASVGGALSCALAIQDAIREQNAALPAERRLRFRIGVHLGDVQVKNGDLFGDAVNMRKEALCDGAAEGIARSALQGGRRWPSPAASAYPQPCASISVITSQPSSPISARNRSRTSPSRCTSFASSGQVHSREQRRPPHSTRMSASGVPWMRPEDHAHMLEGLRKAGWQG